MRSNEVNQRWSEYAQTRITRTSKITFALNLILQRAMEMKLFLGWQQCAHVTKKDASYQAEYVGRNSLQRYSGIKITVNVGNKKEK